MKVSAMNYDEIPVFTCCVFTFVTVEQCSRDVDEELWRTWNFRHRCDLFIDEIQNVIQIKVMDDTISTCVRGKNRSSSINTFIGFLRNLSGLPFFVRTKFRKNISNCTQNNLDYLQKSNKKNKTSQCIKMRRYMDKEEGNGHKFEITGNFGQTGHHP